MSTAWTDREIRIAAEIYRTTPGVGTHGHQCRAIYLIAHAIRRSEHAVYGRLRKHGETFDGPDRRRKRLRRSEQVPLYRMITSLSVPSQVWADRERRCALEPATITAALCGDPLPGYSALDRRRG